jgi:WD40 repeat protein
MMQTATKPEATGRTLCRVFLCHNSADKPLVKEIADRLELDFGVLHFLDAFDIPTAAAFRPWIEQALRESTGCAIFLGANGWGPTHLWEAEQALAKEAQNPGFQLIPVALPGIRDGDMSRLDGGSVFRDLNWADFRAGIDAPDSLDKLHAVLTGESVSDGKGPARLTPYQIRRDAARWLRSARKDSSILYRGPQLEQAERLTTSIPDLTTKSEVAPFLLASAHRQRSVWRRIAVAALAASLAIGGLGIASEVMRELSEQRRVAALSRQIAMEARLEPTPAMSLLLATEAYRESAGPDTAGALFESLQEWPHLVRLLHGDVGSLRSVAWADDSTVMAGTARGELLQWSTKTFERTGETTKASTGAVASLSVDKGGRIWAGYEDGRAILWDGAGRRTPVKGIPPGLNIDQIADVNHLGLGPPISAISLSPDRRLAALGTGAGIKVAEVYLIDQATNTVVGAPISIGVPRVNALAFDPHSRALAAGTGFGSVVIIDTDRRTVSPLKGPALAETLAVLITGDGLIAVGDTGVVSVWTRAGGFFEFFQQFKTKDALTAAAIRPDGKKIALGDASGDVHLFDIAQKRITDSFRAHTGPIYGTAWNPSGTQLATAGSDGNVDIWDFRQPSSISHPKGSVPYNVLTLAKAGNELLVGRSAVGSAEVWQWGEPRWTLKIDLLKETLSLLGDRHFEASKPKPDKDGFVPVEGAEVEQIAIDSKGERVVWATRDGYVITRSLLGRSPATLIRAGGQDPKPPTINISPNGHYLAIAGASHEVRLHDLSAPSANGSILIRVPDAVRSLGFNPSTTLLAVGFEDGRIGLWSVPDGAPVTQPVQTHVEPAGNVTFSFDGSRLFSNAVVGDGNETSVTVSPIPSLQPSSALVARTSGSPPAMIEVAEHLFATIDNEGRIALWDSDKLVPLGSLTVTDLPLNAAAFDTATGDLLIADADGIIRALDTGGARWQALACTLANRQLTKQEWKSLMAEQPYEETCSVKQRAAVSTPLINLWQRVRNPH